MLIVATAVFDEIHGKLDAGTPEPINWEVLFIQAEVGPEIDGKALTVNVSVFEQPVEFVYVITVVPTAIGETKPELLIVATLVLDEIQGLAEFGVVVLDN